MSVSPDIPLVVICVGSRFHAFDLQLVNTIAAD